MPFLRKVVPLTKNLTGIKFIFKTRLYYNSGRGPGNCEQGMSFRLVELLSNQNKDAQIAAFTFLRLGHPQKKTYQDKIYTCC